MSPDNLLLVVLWCGLGASVVVVAVVLLLVWTESRDTRGPAVPGSGPTDEETDRRSCP